MKFLTTLIALLVVMTVGCTTQRHFSYATGTVFLGQEFRGDGIYVFPADTSQTVTTNAFMTITNATTNITFRVAVANGYSRPVFLETDTENFFRGLSSSKTFYDRNGMDIGFYFGSSLFVFGSPVACEILLGRQGQFCGCTTHVFNYREAVSYTGPERHGFANDTPADAELDEWMITSEEVPMNTMTMELDVPINVTYYLLGDPHRYTKSLELRVLVKRGNE